MKRIITIILLVCAVSATALAQPRQNQKGKGPAEQTGHKKIDRVEMAQKMEAQKIAFYTEAIGLSPDEAKDFWAVYNSVEEDQKVLSKAERDAFKALNDAIKEQKSDAEVNKLLDAYIKASEENVNLHFKAAGSYKAILEPAKVAKFFAAQERFRRQQFNNLRSGRPGAPGQGDPGQGGPRGPRPDGDMQGAPAPEAM